MKRSSLVLALPIALLASASAHADVLDVRGPSPDFSQISAAVNAARDGDVIRVWPGSYQPFTILDESLTLVKATTTGNVRVAGTIRIRELSAGRSVELVGIEATGDDGRGLVVSDCQGSVRVREGVFVGADNIGAAWPYDGHDGALITGCHDVELTSCTLIGGNPTYGEYGGSGGRGLEVVMSNLSAFDSWFEGQNGSTDDDPGASGYPGGSGIEAWGVGRSYVSGCTLVGGHGGDADYDPDWLTGEYGYGGSGGWGFYGPSPVEPWFLDNDYQPGGGGTSPDSTHHGYPGQATSFGTQLPGAARLLRASALVDDQGDIGLRFEGAPGEQVFLRVALAPAYQFSALLGPLLVAAPPLSPFNARHPFAPVLGWRAMGALNSSGLLITSIPARELPTFGHAVPHVQGGFVGAQTYYGSSSWSVVLDTAW